MNLSAVILAGGESTRMGRDKAWVELGGKPLLALAVERIRALGIAEIFISGRAGEDYSAVDGQVLLDLEPGFGPLGGIERGLHECSSPLLLVLAVDLPQMTAAFLKKLVARCAPLTGVVPKLHGQLEPLAAIYPKRCHAFAFDALSKSRRVAQDFAKACLHEQAVRTFSVPAADARCFANWNTPADVVGGQAVMSAGERAPLVYACSGASSAAQMANHIAVKLDRLRVAEMSCIAGVGGDVKPLVRTAKSGRPIIALDGCPLHCSARILKRHGLKADKHYDLSELEVKKRMHEDFDPQEAARVLQHILSDSELLAGTGATAEERTTSPVDADGTVEGEPCECASSPCYLSEFTAPDSSGNLAR